MKVNLLYNMNISREEFVLCRNKYKDYSISFLGSLAEKLDKEVSEINKKITEYAIKNKEVKEKELILTWLVLRYRTLIEYNKQLNERNIKRFLRQQYETMTCSCVPAYSVWICKINNKSNLFLPQKLKDNQLSFGF